jgi:hypothetical protein
MRFPKSAVYLLLGASIGVVFLALAHGGFASAPSLATTTNVDVKVAPHIGEPAAAEGPAVAASRMTATSTHGGPPDFSARIVVVGLPVNDGPDAGVIVRRLGDGHLTHQSLDLARSWVGALPALTHAIEGVTSKSGAFDVVSCDPPNLSVDNASVTVVVRASEGWLLHAIDGSTGTRLSGLVSCQDGSDNHVGSDGTVWMPRELPGQAKHYIASVAGFTPRRLAHRAEEGDAFVSFWRCGSIRVRLRAGHSVSVWSSDDGRIVHLVDSDPRRDRTVDVEELKPGQYILHVATENGVCCGEVTVHPESSIVINAEDLCGSLPRQATLHLLCDGDLTKMDSVNMDLTVASIPYSVAIQNQGGGSKLHQRVLRSLASREGCSIDRH